MATQDRAQVFRAPFKAFIDPTDVGLGEPYGGTALGITGALRVRYERTQLEVVAEEYGEIVEEALGGYRIMISTTFRQWDEKSLALLFPDTAVAGGQPKVDVPGTARSGRKGSAEAVKILFVPRNFLEHPSIIVYRAIPRVVQETMLEWTQGAELIVATGFQAIRDASNRQVQKALLSEIDL